MTLKVGSEVLFGRYRVVSALQSPSAPQPKVWLAEDSYDLPVLLKTWEFSGERPDHVQRALWDVELRNLLRLASVPGVDAHLVTLHDAGIDPDLRLFVMVLRSLGFTPLDSVLERRAKYPWLTQSKKPEVRAELWRALLALSKGLATLHDHHILHRAIGANSVYLNPDEGPRSMRLGGFEWAIRLGSHRHADAPGSASVSPVGGDPVHSFGLDVLHFGLLATRLVANVSVEIDNISPQSLAAAARQLHANAALDPLEKETLDRLIAPDPKARLSRGRDVEKHLRDVVQSLEQATSLGADAHLGLIVDLAPGRPLSLAIAEQDESIVANDIVRQREFIEHDLIDARVQVRSGPPVAYSLIGRRLAYQIHEWAPTGVTPSGQWQLAYASAPARAGWGDVREVSLRLPVRVHARRDVRQGIEHISRRATPWRAVLPQLEAGHDVGKRLQDFRDFFRITNQIELLFRDAEIFAYEVIADRSTSDRESLVLREVPRKRAPFAYGRVQGNMATHVRELLAEGRDNRVQLTDSEEFSLAPVDEHTLWNIEHPIDTEHATIKVSRTRVGAPAPLPRTGFLRSYEMQGNLHLVNRRRTAIERLQQHAYLLRSLLMPDHFHIDIGDAPPAELDPEKLDPAKQRALGLIWRTRPIFALQGPPGTGKTTLVANLLGQVFHDDPVAQVLVTAQAHTAVDVLREKVRKEIFDEVPDYDQPLAVRLSRRRERGDEQPDQDEVKPVTERMLGRAIELLEQRPELRGVAAKWLAIAKDTLRGLARGDDDGRDLLELVKRSANITYCTTTSGDLAELATGAQSFDWSIIEEAGKAHGFDLVLPLQTGHRWVLIGDQNQLPPYRYENFRQAVEHLDETIEALDALPARGARLVDWDFVRDWKNLPDVDREGRKALWLAWVPVFQRLYLTCERAARDGGASPLADMLSQQHRMHPVIAELVSRAYYDRKLQSATVDEAGQPVPRVVHPFVAPEAVSGKAIVWLDVGLSEESGEDSAQEADAVTTFLRALQVRDADDSARLKVAVLTPYRKQVALLRAKLAGLRPPPWLANDAGATTAGPLGLVQTVDSFQGNQADIVLVSLVRNGLAAPGKGLGFLKWPERMNVLVSRAERLLVLVGSFEFFKRQVSEVQYAGHPLNHLRVFIEYLSECFSDGRAVRIDARVP